MSREYRMSVGLRDEEFEGGADEGEGRVAEVAMEPAVFRLSSGSAWLPWFMVGQKGALAPRRPLFSKSLALAGFKSVYLGQCSSISRPNGTGGLLKIDSPSGRGQRRLLPLYSRLVSFSVGLKKKIAPKPLGLTLGRSILT